MARFEVRRLERSADVDFSDLTTARRTGPAVWVDEATLEIPFDAEPTEPERDAILLRLTTPDVAAEEQQQTLEEAVAGNLAYLSRASTTSVQDKAQIKALTRQVDALIARFQRGRSGGNPDT